MRKIFPLIIALVLCISTLAGCGDINHYTDEEKKYISEAVEKVEREYDIDINVDSFIYSVGAQVFENEFEDLENVSNPQIISVSATPKNKIEKGITSFSVTYRTINGEIININCDNEVE